jgi:hypothetical protein
VQLGGEPTDRLTVGICLLQVLLRLPNRETMTLTDSGIWAVSKRQGAEMRKASGAAAIGRRIVLKAGAALAAAGPAILGVGHAEAQPRATRGAALFAYVGSFTTADRKGHGGGINVFRVDPASGVWAHEQLLEIVNPSFLALDRTSAGPLSSYAMSRTGVRATFTMPASNLERDK